MTEKDSGQLTFQTMGGDTVIVPQRGRHYVEPRGYAMPPGTGPEGESCKTCRWLTYVALSRCYPKCELRRSTWTHGRGTDILVKAKACGKWAAKSGNAQKQVKKNLDP